jgi:hypothetical protein
MSEYQYYEFQAVDRPLSEAEMRELRGISSRAEITPNRFMNVYNYGDFRGNPGQLMEKYFDIFVYDSNWGQHELMLRLPQSLLDVRATEPFVTDETLDTHAASAFTLVRFQATDEEKGGGWVEEEESEAWLPRLLHLRQELATGDFRALYLGWLAGAQSGIIDDDTPEPPVPPGLQQLSPALKALVSFLWLDDDLIAVAAEQSVHLRVTHPSRDDQLRWLAGIPESEKDALLVRLLEGEGAQLQLELQRRLQQATASVHAAVAANVRRTVAQLIATADERRETRQRIEAERAAQEKTQKQREAAARRATYLRGLEGQEEELWRKVENLVRLTKQAEYDLAVPILLDLRDLAGLTGQQDVFIARLGHLRKQHRGKPSFIQRLDKAQLLAE